MKKIIYLDGERIRDCILIKELNPINEARVGLFKCYCGTIFKCRIHSIANGKTKSCGCFKQKATKERFTKHGLHGSKYYYTWKSMKIRCYNEKTRAYKWYGARGITVCDEWKEDFKAFFDYISTLPNFGKKGYTLDRIENEGNYKPKNVQWSTQHEQATNSRKRSDNTSGYTGVYVKGDKYTACIGINRKLKHIGVYNTIKEAIEGRNNYIKTHGLTEYKIQKYHEEKIKDLTS